MSDKHPNPHHQQAPVHGSEEAQPGLDSLAPDDREWRPTPKPSAPGTERASRACSAILPGRAGSTPLGQTQALTKTDCHLPVWRKPRLRLLPHPCRALPRRKADGGKALHKVLCRARCKVRCRALRKVSLPLGKGLLPRPCGLQTAFLHSSFLPPSGPMTPPHRNSRHCPQPLPARKEPCAPLQ